MDETSTDPLQTEDTRSLALARRHIQGLLEDDPQHALAACAAEDPLRVQARAAVRADDEGLIYDPSDVMVDAYVALVREPGALADLDGWFRGPFKELTEQVAAEPVSPALSAALGRALGVADERVEAWVELFRSLALPDRRDVLALLRACSPSFREVYGGRAFDLRKDTLAVHRAYSLYRALLTRVLA